MCGATCQSMKWLIRAPQPRGSEESSCENRRTRTHTFLLLPPRKKFLCNQRAMQTLSWYILLHFPECCPPSFSARATMVGWRGLRWRKVSLMKSIGLPPLGGRMWWGTSGTYEWSGPGKRHYLFSNEGPHLQRSEGF